ncbi:arginase [Paenibacillus sp. NEAU-GSW1]|uniref:arginase n=1 Tax=Paenibacillus sp. NEAU-GSW1 TaxID=2682486 RepID=UPI0012E13893|nr:arginase [Paenibacillus sp. NEAU-GSW1]MUT66202.1 arginase [Paenibacillus sp. NEAU-GSW1]
MKDVALVSVPFGLGAGCRGSEHGPDALRRLGLLSELAKRGIRVASEAEATLPAASNSPAWQLTAAYAGRVPAMKHAAEVMGIGIACANQASAAIAASTFPVVVGGDHSIAIGTMAGLSAHYERPGIIWFDAHADLNTEATSLSGNMHGIALAVALGTTDLPFDSLHPAAKPVDLQRVVLIGARDLDPAELQWMRHSGVAYFDMAAIRALGMEEVAKRALHIAGGDGADAIHLSFDIDSIDPTEAPGTGTPVTGGISSAEARIALRAFGESPLLASADFVELNPLLDQGNRTAKLMISLIGELLAARKK